MKVDKDNRIALLSAFVRLWLHDLLPGSKRPPVCRSVSAASFLIAALFTLWLATRLSAQTPQAALPIPFAFTVNSTSDAGDSVINGVCETSPGNGECTLRAAIQESNAHSGADFIDFNLPGPSTIILNTALPLIADGVNITGPGADKLTVTRSTAKGTAPFRIFEITTTGTVNLSGLTIAGGIAPEFEDGGGIEKLNAGSVNISRCVLSSNSATHGGGIANEGGTLTISGSTVRDNSANSAGSGVYNGNNSTLNVTATTIEGNSAENGGGIYNGSGIVTVTDSTFRSNITNGQNLNGENLGGGAISNSGTLIVTNSTFSGNSASAAAGKGGAINSSGIVSITNSTIGGNFAPDGGGIFINGGTANVKSTIIAKNTGITGLDAFGAFSSEGFNLVGQTDGSTGFGVSTDLTGTSASPLDPKLGPLQDNGGPTETMALLPGSPAIDKGTSDGLTGKLTSDQRGVGYARTVNKSVANTADGTDIGAFELGAQIKAVSRKTHGTAGMFDISLPLFGPKLGVECRKGGSSKTFKIVVIFPTAVTVGSASVTPDPKAPGATGSVSGASVSGRVVTVNLTGVSNAQTILVDLFDVSDGTNTNDVSIPMGMLFGDTNNNKSVSSTDVTLTQSKVGQALSAANFREDVDINGSINSTDVQTVQSKVGTKLP
jgi:Dockerin type I domain